MKLVHEMDHRPNFGTQFTSDPDGEVRLWLARVKALISRVGVSETVHFNAALSTATSYWPQAMDSLQVVVREAIESLKLQLELYQDENIGRVFEASERYEFGKALKAICDGAHKEVFIVDPYFDPSAFDLLISGTSIPKTRLLMGKGVEAVRDLARRHAQDSGCDVEVKSSKAIHDRLIIVDNCECWLIGASIKDGGRKPTYVMPLAPGLFEKKREIYERIWNE